MSRQISDGQLLDARAYYRGGRLTVCDGKGGKMGGWVRRQTDTSCRAACLDGRSKQLQKGAEGRQGRRTHKRTNEQLKFEATEQGARINERERRKRSDGWQTTGRGGAWVDPRSRGGERREARTDESRF